jgi:bacterioferritin-associated ferredoxin
MYVCLCKGITDHQIKEAVYDGATSVRELRKTLGVTSQCGKCALTTREILNQSLQPAQECASAPFYAVA